MTKSKIHKETLFLLDQLTISLNQMSLGDAQFDHYLKYAISESNTINKALIKIKEQSNEQ